MNWPEAIFGSVALLVLAGLLKTWLDTQNKK